MNFPAVPLNLGNKVDNTKHNQCGIKFLDKTVKYSKYHATIINISGFNSILLSQVNLSRVIKDMKFCVCLIKYASPF